MERQKFEDSFKEAFQRAEVDPSDHVWTNIELDLERLEGGKMKRRLLFFKMVAAASVVFAMAIGGTGYFVYQKEKQGMQETLLAQQKSDQTSASNAKANEITDNINAHDPSGSGFEKADDQPSTDIEQLNQAASAPDHTGNEGAPISPLAQSSESMTTNHPGSTMSSQQKSQVRGNNNATTFSKDKNNQQGTFDYEQADQVPSNHLQVTLADTGDSLEKENTLLHEDVLLREGRLPVLVTSHKISVPNMPQDSRLTPTELLLIQLAEDKKLEEKASRERPDERIWTSVGFSAGTFNNINASAPALARAPSASRMTNYSVASNTLSNETNASGFAYSVGISLGGKLADRWVLQGGFNYMQQNANFTSDAVVTTDHQKFSAPSSVLVNESSSAFLDQSVIPTAPYNVNNNIQFISLPLQVGFIVIDKSIGLQLNGGIATDFFLQNTVTPTQGSLSKATYGRGEDSPYRPINFSGLVGTELSYRFTDRYRIAINPGLRYPFSSMYKSDAGLEAVPVTFDVGLKFRYIFR